MWGCGKNHSLQTRSASGGEGVFPFHRRHWGQGVDTVDTVQSEMGGSSGLPFNALI